MKLYFYFLERPYNGKPYIHCEECEVINKPKTYKPADKFPKKYCGYYVRKEDVGRLIGFNEDVVVLTSNDSNVAMKLFRDNANKKIKRHEYQINKLKDELAAVEKWKVSQ